MARIPWLAVFWLGACGGLKDPPATQDSDSGDSGTDTSVDTGDSDTGEETADTAVEEPLTFTFNLDLAPFVAADGLALNLVYGELREGRVNLGATWQRAAIDTTSLSVELPIPDASHLSQPDPGLWPDFYLGTFIPTLIGDLDGDLEHDPGESLEGVGLEWPAYATGEIPEEYAALGMHAGWNVLVISEGAVPTTTGDPTDVPILSNMYPNGAIGLTGTYAGPDDVSTLRLALLPKAAFASGDYSGLLYDQPASTDWVIVIQTLPAAAWIAQIGDTDYSADTEAIVTYVDTNMSGSLDPADAIRSVACSNGLPVGPMFLMRPFDLTDALPLALEGIVPGWFSANYDGDLWAPTGPDDLVIDGTCSLGW